MGNQQFHRVVIRHEVKLVDGRFLGRADLRCEDVVIQMLLQAYGGFDVLHLKLLQQSLQLWKLLFRKRNILHCFGELIERLQFRGEVCEKGSVGKNAVIVEDNGVFPIQSAELLLRRSQRFF